jgi:hypothetical protein
MGNVFKEYSKYENLNFNVRFKQQKRNFIQSLNPSQSNNHQTYSVESNVENRIVANLTGQ